MHTDISFYGEVLYEILQIKAEVGLRRFLVRLNIHDTALATPLSIPIMSTTRNEARPLRDMVVTFITLHMNMVYRLARTRSY
jgi:hypothetical protein